MDLLERLYNDPKEGFIGADKIYRKAKAIDSSITKRQVVEWYKNQSFNQQFSINNKKRFDEFKIASDNPNEWQIDLAFWKKQPILSAVNINSRIGYAQLLKDKRSPTVKRAIEDFTNKHVVSAVFSDNGTEFTNNLTEKFFKDKSITHANAFAGDHTVLGKIDRFIRTIKMRLSTMKEAKHFSNITQKILDDIIANYNNTYHTSIKATPNQMKGKVIFDEIDHNKRIVEEVNKSIPIGSFVRYRLKSKTFQKEAAKWSKVVYEVMGLDGLKMKIKSKNNHVRFNPVNDLLIVNSEPNNADLKNNAIWEVEEVLDHKKLKNSKYKFLIKWLNHKEPTWEPQSNLRLVQKNRMSKLERDYFKSKGLETE
jgi:hypothetical protein